MDDPLFTYTDVDGDDLRISRDYAVIHVSTVDRDGEATIVRLPHHVVPTLAKEVLAAAGDSKHAVVDVARTNNLMRASKEYGARSMREAAAELSEHWGSGLMTRPQLAAAIRALPLLPSDGGGADPCRSHTLIEGIDVYCEHSSGAGHDGLHYARVSGTTRTWTEPDTSPTPVHVATPEGITPCGEGHLDVIVAALISEVTCVECLRAVAIEKGEQVVELRRELDAESARVSAARDERDQALRSVRELPARTTQLEHDMASAEQRLAALEIAQREHTQSGGAEHVQVTGGGCPSTTGRYRDADGITWEVIDNRARVVEGRGGRAIPDGTFGWWPLDVVRERYGRLTPVSKETAGGDH